MDVTIYHNPRCSTSRNVLAMIREAGHEPVVIEYLKDPPMPARILELADAAGLSLRELIRRKETAYAELGLADPSLDDDALARVMSDNPVLIERPVVATGKGVRLCRPKERVLEIL